MDFIIAVLEVGFGNAESGVTAIRTRSFPVVDTCLNEVLVWAKSQPGCHGRLCIQYDDAPARYGAQPLQPTTQPARNVGTGGNPTEYQPVTTCGG